MKKNRRTFLRTLGLGSGALMVSPVQAFEVKGDEVRPSAPLNDKEGVYAVRELETDVCVVGGGMAGLSTALAAARNGAKVILLQNRSRLGGNASSEIRMHICGATQLKQVWRETGIIEELMLTESVTNAQASYEILDYVFYNKLRSEPNITVLLDTVFYEVETKKDQITSIKAHCSQTEEIYQIRAHSFADCTGDGTLAALAGADYMRGREAKETYDESLGLDKADDITMGNSLMFEAQEHDKPMPFKAPSWARKYTFKDFQHRRIGSYEYGYWWVELGGMENIVHDGQKIREDLMAVIFGVWDYVKNSGDHPKSANWALSWFGLIPGKRESRRITGDYVMSQRDVQAPTLLEDRVAYGGWPLDDHLPEGMDDTSQKPFRSIPLKGPYSIPLRSLYSKNFTNLYMAGRNISVSHVALSTTRVMATCAAIGQATGTAMAYSLKHQLTPRKLAGDKKHLTRFQQLLLRQDQSLLGIKNQDPQDRALRAKVQASAQTQAGAAAQVIDGINRDVQDGSSHQWQAPVNSQPWIELSWDSPATLAQIECTFDTGLNRYLRLSGQASVFKNQVRGYQPETVSDFKLEVFNKGQVVYETFIEQNYLRKFVHSFPEVQADQVRLTVHRTHGDELARIFEIRCYGEAEA